eukprot:Opistho-1_new@44601
MRCTRGLRTSFSSFALSSRPCSQTRRQPTCSARANLSLFIIYNWNWGVSFDNASRDTHKAAAASSISLLLRERDFSDPIRAFEMGYCHYAGVGTERDFGKAYALFQQSSTGCMAGTVAVGWCLAYGDGIACDKTSAAHYFELAASKWHPEGMLMYGKCLCQGEGVPRDEKKGLALIQHAAELENWWAKEWLEKSSYVDPPPEPTVAPAAATTARAASATPSAEGASQRERRCAVM